MPYCVKKTAQSNWTLYVLGLVTYSVTSRQNRIQIGLNYKTQPQVIQYHSNRSWLQELNSSSCFHQRGESAACERANGLVYTSFSLPNILINLGDTHTHVKLKILLHYLPITLLPTQSYIYLRNYPPPPLKMCTAFLTG